MGILDRWDRLLSGPAAPEPPSPRTIRALTAAGARVNLASPGLAHTRHPEWQTSAWSYRDSVDELRFASEFIENCMSQVRIHAAAVPDDDEQDPQPLDGDDEIPGVDPATQAAAVALIDRLQWNAQGSGQVARAAVNLDIAGECYLVGEAGDEGEQWTIRSVSELIITAGGARLIDPNGSGVGRELRADECDVLRLWNPHARYYDMPDSPVAAMLGTLEGMVLLARRGRAHDRSRISNGTALYVPDEFTLNVPGAPALDADGYPEGDVGDDPDADPFMAELTRAMTSPIADEEDPSAVAPIIIRGPSMFGDRPAADILKAVRLHDEDPKDLDTRYEALVQRFTRGINLAKERVQGLGDTNHWNGALISADEFKMHVRPRAIRLCDSLTAAYLRTGLQAMGISLEQRQRVCCWFDASALVKRPDREDAAQAVHTAGALSDKALRKHRGFDDDDAPTDAERIIRLLTNANTDVASIPYVAQLAAMEVSDPRVKTALLTAAEQVARARGGGQPGGGRTIVDATPHGADPAAPALDSTPAPSPATPASAPAGVTAAGKRAGPRDDPDGPSVAGLALMAADTGRVLMLQRSVSDETDPAAGTWEFPGGHIEPGDETSLHGAMREWSEEVGQPVPDGGLVLHTWTSRDGVYQGHVVVIPTEDALDLGAERSVSNPDDDAEQCAWWEPEHARKNPALRPECRRTPWSALARAVKTGRSPLTAALGWHTVLGRADARWKLDRRAGRRLVAIDRDLVTTIHAHAESAVERAVEKAANRIRGHHARKSSPLAASFPRGGDARPVVAAAGESIALDLGGVDLLDGALDSLEAVWTREVARAAAAVEAQLAAMLARGAVTAAAGHVGVAQQIVERGRAAWRWLAPRLLDRARDVLFGRAEGPAVPVSLVSGAVAQAGGLPETSGGVRDDGTLVDGGATGAGGPGTGAVVLSEMRTAGALIIGFEWDYHPGIERETFLAHAKLDEQTFERADDPALAVATGDEWLGSHYHPNDHRGCRCGTAPVAIIPLTDAPDPRDPQVGELARGAGLDGGRPL